MWPWGGQAASRRKQQRARARPTLQAPLSSTRTTSQPPQETALASGWRRRSGAQRASRSVRSVQCRSFRLNPALPCPRCVTTDLLAHCLSIYGKQLCRRAGGVRTASGAAKRSAKLRRANLQPRQSALRPRLYVKHRQTSAPCDSTEPVIIPYLATKQAQRPKALVICWSRAAHVRTHAGPTNRHGAGVRLL